MCLAVPGKITELFVADNMHMAKVSFEGVMRDVCVEAIENAQVGSYVIVHAGFALNTLDEEEAQETLRMLREMQMLDSEANSDSQ